LEGGNTSNAKSVGGGVYELKMDFGPGYRVYFGYDGPKIVILLAGGTKKRQGKNIETAKKRWTDYKERKKRNIERRAFKMPLTRKFKETVMLRAKQDPDFRQELIVEATNAFLDGDIDTGKRLIRDYLNATEAFPSIAEELKQNEKSIRRMIGPRGNPTLRNFANLLNACKRRESLELRVCR
jgi:hypothetical protein